MKNGIVNARGNNGKTALMRTAEEGDVETVKILLKIGADVNARDNDGNTALMWVDKSPETAKVLLKYGADVKARDNDGDTALMSAANEGNADVAEVLIKHGADVNARDSYGNTALLLAAPWGYTKPQKSSWSMVLMSMLGTMTAGRL